MALVSAEAKLIHRVVNEEDRLKTQAILDRMTELADGLRQALSDHLWASIPQHVVEHAYSAAQNPGVPLNVAPQTANLELITSVVAVVPDGMTGLVQLDDLNIPCSAGVNTFAPVKKLLTTRSLRSITLAGDGAGPVLLWLSGEQLPTFGTLAK